MHRETSSYSPDVGAPRYFVSSLMVSIGSDLYRYIVNMQLDTAPSGASE